MTALAWARASGSYPRSAASVDQRLLVAGEGRRVRGGDQDPAGRPGGPQLVQGRHVPHVFEHHQPRQAGLAEPPGEPAGDRLAVAGQVGLPHRRRGLRVARQHGGPLGAGHPDQQFQAPGLPERLGDAHRELGLAAGLQPAAGPLPGDPGRDQDHHGTGDQGRREVGGRVRPRAEPIGERGHHARPDRPHRPALCPHRPPEVIPSVVTMLQIARLVGGPPCTTFETTVSQSGRWRARRRMTAGARCTARRSGARRRGQRAGMTMPYPWIFR